jgi:alkyl sulfatase BDS1-like metallo-beta-lactamase superfamily hydrolase
VVFADPGHAAAKSLLADVFEQLGYGSENGTWRCEFLSAAMELRTGNSGTPTAAASADIVSHLSPDMLFGALAVQVGRSASPSPSPHRQPGDPSFNIVEP